MEEVVVLGATGLCASAFVKKALTQKEVARIWTFARRKNPSLPESDKIVEYVSNADEWESAIPSATSSNSLVFSGIATTRAAAGGLDKQRLVDHDLQVKMAKIVKAKGYKTFILISSGGANVNSYMGYFKLKGEIEEDIKAIGFDRTFIIRPGPLLGRETTHSGFGSSVMEAIFPKFYRSWCSGLAMHPAHADDVASAAFKLAETAPAGVSVVQGKQVVDLGTE